MPGLPGRAVERMATRIRRDHPFRAAFETRVARDMAEVVPRAYRAANGIRHASVAGRIVGTIPIDGAHPGDGLAQRRWFVLADGLRGRGVGRPPPTRALDHCDAAGFRETQLWAVAGRDAARRLTIMPVSSWPRRIAATSGAAP